MPSAAANKPTLKAMATCWKNVDFQLPGLPAKKRDRPERLNASAELIQRHLEVAPIKLATVILIDDYSSSPSPLSLRSLSPAVSQATSSPASSIYSSSLFPSFPSLSALSSLLSPSPSPSSRILSTSVSSTSTLSSPLPDFMRDPKDPVRNATRSPKFSPRRFNRIANQSDCESKLGDTDTRHIEIQPTADPKATMSTSPFTSLKSITRSPKVRSRSQGGMPIGLLLGDDDKKSASKPITKFASRSSPEICLDSCRNREDDDETILANHRNLLRHSVSHVTTSQSPASCPDCRLLAAYEEAVTLHGRLQERYESCKTASIFRRYGRLRSLVREATSDKQLKQLRVGIETGCSCGQRRPSQGGGARRGDTGVLGSMMDAMRPALRKVKSILHSVPSGVAIVPTLNGLFSASPSSSCLGEHEWQRSRIVLLERHLQRLRADVVASSKSASRLRRYRAMKRGIKQVVGARMV